MFSIMWGVEQPARNYAEAKQQDTQAFARFFRSMLASGVHLPPSAFEAWFVSVAHDEEALTRLAEALPGAARAAARAEQ
jgi:glutamate-1-semialdehyde 2,1-aminomutase